MFVGASLLCAIVRSADQLILFRALQGIGAGGLVPLSQIIIADLIPPRERGRYQGTIGIVYAFASVAGPAIGGFITDALSWHWIFFLNLPIGVAGLFLVRAFIPDIHEDNVAPLDLRGFVLAGLSLAGLVFGFSAMGRGLLTFWQVVVGFFVMVICQPLVEGRLHLWPIKMTTLFALVFAGFVGSGVAYYLWFEIVRRLSAMTASLGVLSAPAVGEEVSVAGQEEEIPFDPTATRR